MLASTAPWVPTSLPLQMEAQVSDDCCLCKKKSFSDKIALIDRNTHFCVHYLSCGEGIAVYHCPKGNDSQYHCMVIE